MTQPASDPQSSDFSPRWIEVRLEDLERGCPSEMRVRGRQELELGQLSPGWEALAEAGGSALGLALLARHPDALVISVGDCVRRAVPTAARATLAARSPLTGVLTEGQVGSELGRRLVGLCDSFALSGRARQGDLLIVRPTSVELTHLELGSEAKPSEIGAALRAEHGDCAWIAVGPAGARAHSLATLTVGDETPHVVGRGGLGAVLGRTGLRAIVVALPLPSGGAEPSEDVLRALLRSPHLATRAAGGTFELFDARSAGAALFERGGAVALERNQALALARGAEAAAKERHGCRGCPTPCGWRFERPADEARPARFGATYALGPNLGLDELDDALDLLAECDDLGLDAKEVGAVLALAARAREEGRLDGAPTWGARSALVKEIHALASNTGAGSPLASGLATLARELDYPDAFVVKGQSVAPEPDDLGLLALCVSWRGADPMRTFPFALASLTPERIAELIAPLPFAPASGRLIWWHENLSLALDATGFCSFSAAGLLADHVVDLDGLARWIAPAALRRSAAFEEAPGAHLLAFGQALALAQRELGQSWIGALSDEELAAFERPAWARARLETGGTWDEYRHLRGLDGGGRVAVGALARAVRWGEFDPRGGLAESPAEVSSAAPVTPVPETRRGVVDFLAGGPLGRLVDGARVETELPAPLGSVVAELAAVRPEAADWLLRDGRLLPAVFRAGDRLASDSPVRAGDRLELVVAIAGGSGREGRTVDQGESPPCNPSSDAAPFRP